MGALYQPGKYTASCKDAYGNILPERNRLRRRVISDLNLQPLPIA